MQDVKRIESYGLYDFCQDVQAAFQEGYVFDFDTNENFPTAYGTMLTCGLVKATGKKVETEETVTQTEQTEEVVQEVEQVTTEVEQVVTEVEEVVQEVEQVTTEVEQVVTEVEEVVTEVAEVPETAPAKRGPKPKNK